MTKTYFFPLSKGDIEDIKKGKVITREFLSGYLNKKIQVSVRQDEMHDIAMFLGEFIDITIQKGQINKLKKATNTFSFSEGDITVTLLGEKTYKYIQQLADQRLK